MGQYKFYDSKQHFATEVISSGNNTKTKAHQ